MNLNSLGYQTEHKEELDLVRRTHEIFVGLKGKDICLFGGDPPGRTDCETFITVPLEDPYVATIHKHEWQHVFFKTNLRARALFVTQYEEQLFGRTATRIPRGEVTRFLHILANALDDLRVSSLWFRIYPHSAEQVRERWVRMLATYRNREDLVAYVMTVGLGCPMSSVWEKYHPVVKRACDLVEGSGYPAVLATTKLIIDAILEDAALAVRPPAAAPRPAPGPAAGQGQGRQGVALRRLARRAGSEPGTDPEAAAQRAVVVRAVQTKHVTGFDDTPRLGTREPDPESWMTRAMVKSAMEVKDEQVEILTEKSRKDMDEVVQKIRTRTTLYSDEQRLKHGVDATFIDVGKRDLTEAILEPQDKRLVEAMHHRFARLMDRRTRRTDATGVALNPNAYIDMMLGSGDTDIFEEEAPSKGFSALILVDMSSSMIPRWSVVARAAKTLSKAMKFPFSQFEVWGFSGTGQGETLIFRFHDPEWGLSGRGVERAWGFTPLHVAAALASRRVCQMPGSVQHLFIITDGLPCALLRNRLVVIPHAQLVNEVESRILGARRKGVNVSALVIGNDVPDTDAQKMFGKKSWSRVGNSQEDLFREMVGLVEKAFLGYLKVR